jgi:phosphatidylserine decarboxylase
MCKGALFSFFQHLIPQHLLSRTIAKLAFSENVRLKNFLILKFMAHFNLDLKEAERENYEDYKHFNDFFTRTLKPSARKISSEREAFISPVDGNISQIGRVNQKGRLIQAKGRDFSLIELLGGEFKEIHRFYGSFFTTIYLAPYHYHRVHLPMDAELLALTYCPGDLFSVNPSTAQNVNNLFARNERAAMFFQTEHGLMAVVMVGAMLVAGIETVFAGKITPSNRKEILHIDYQNDTKTQKHFKRGDELGLFQFGSTVIILHESPILNIDEHLSEKAHLKMGQKIGEFKPTPNAPF